MTKTELGKILEDHKLWLDTDGEEGSRADLSGAHLYGDDLSRANLREADLSRANLYRANLYEIRNKEIRTFQFNKHFAYCCDGYIRIGCITKSIETWLEDYEDIGKDQSYSSEEIKEYGDFIKYCKRRQMNANSNRN